MAYFLDIAPADQQYLDGLPLSPAAKGKLARFMDRAVREATDAHRLDPVNRLGPAPVFLVQFALQDGGRNHVIDLHIDDSAAAVGVLRLAYADHFSPG